MKIHALLAILDLPDPRQVSIGDKNGSVGGCRDRQWIIELRRSGRRILSEQEAIQSENENQKQTTVLHNEAPASTVFAILQTRNTYRILLSIGSRNGQAVSAWWQQPVI